LIKAFPTGRQAKNQPYLIGKWNFSFVKREVYLWHRPGQKFQKTQFPFLTEPDQFQMHKKGEELFSDYPIFE